MPTGTGANKNPTRGYRNRSVGLFKKANTLHQMLGRKLQLQVAVLIWREGKPYALYESLPGLTKRFPGPVKYFGPDDLEIGTMRDGKLPMETQLDDSQSTTSLPSTPTRIPQNLRDRGCPHLCDVNDDLHTSHSRITTMSSLSTPGSPDSSDSSIPGSQSESSFSDATSTLSDTEPSPHHAQASDLSSAPSQQSNHGPDAPEPSDRGHRTVRSRLRQLMLRRSPPKSPLHNPFARR